MVTMGLVLSGDGYVEVKLSPSPDIMQRLGKEETEGFVLGVIVDDWNKKEYEKERVKEANNSESNEQKGEAEDKTYSVEKRK